MMRQTLFGAPWLLVKWLAVRNGEISYRLWYRFKGIYMAAPIKKQILLNGMRENQLVDIRLVHIVNCGVGEVIEIENDDERIIGLLLEKASGFAATVIVVTAENETSLLRR